MEGQIDPCNPYGPWEDPLIQRLSPKYVTFTTKDITVGGNVFNGNQIYLNGSSFGTIKNYTVSFDGASSNYTYTFEVI